MEYRLGMTKEETVEIVHKTRFHIGTLRPKLTRPL